MKGENERKLKLADGTIIENKTELKNNSITNLELMACITNIGNSPTLLCRENFGSHKWWSINNGKVKPTLEKEISKILGDQ